MFLFRDTPSLVALPLCVSTHALPMLSFPHPMLSGTLSKILYMRCPCFLLAHCSICMVRFLALSKSLDSVAEDKMLAQGITSFCNDLGVDPASLNVLVIAWVFKAATQCEFTRGEFVQGMTELA